MRPSRFLVLGSASPGLLRQSSESLAGRISYYELNGLGADEIGEGRLNRRWLREFARSFGVADTTVRKYLDILTDTLVVRQLPPWHANLKKRQVKAPKIYLRDSGLAHYLLGIHDAASLDIHPSRGSTWEGLMLELVMERLAATGREFYHWRTHTGAELDLYSRSGSEKLGIEMKLSSAPSVTPSMRRALQDLKLDELWPKKPWQIHKAEGGLPFLSASLVRT